MERRRAMDVLNRGEVVGHLTDCVPDMWYLDGRFTPADTAAGARFVAAASALDARIAHGDPTRGIRVLLREAPDEEGSVFIVMSLSEGHLFGRRVFDPEAIGGLLGMCRNSHATSVAPDCWPCTGACFRTFLAVGATTST